MSNVTPYLYIGVNLSYGLGSAFSRLSNSKTDYSGNGSISAFRRFGLNTDWNSSLGLTGGKLGTSFSFQTGIGYTFRPRKGHTVSIEIDPLNNTLKTKTIKPQVPSGWDYVLRTGYSFGLTKNLGDRGSSGTTAAGGATRSQHKAVTSHVANVNLDVYIGRFTLASNAEYKYSPQISKNFSWKNSIYATVMRKIGVTLGTGLTMDMPESGNKTKNYNLYGRISSKISRTGTLSFNANYTKTTPGNTTTLEITPNLSWRWRSVFVDLALTLRKERIASGAKTTERKIMLRVTRPFKIL